MRRTIESQRLPDEFVELCGAIDVTFGGQQLSVPYRRCPGSCLFAFRDGPWVVHESGELSGPWTGDLEALQVVCRKEIRRLLKEKGILR